MRDAITIPVSHRALRLTMLSLLVLLVIGVVVPLILANVGGGRAAVQQARLVQVRRLALSTAAPCGARQLSAASSLQGATGSAAGGIVFSNRGAKACTLTGRPRIGLTDNRGRALGVRRLRWRQPNPLVTLPPHGGRPIIPATGRETRGKAWVDLWWSNFCKAWPAGGVFAELRLPGRGGSLRVRIFAPKPRCDVPRSPSTLAVGNFQLWSRI